MVKVRKDLTGMKFGKLTVICQYEDYINPKGQHFATWLCKCDCDNPNLIQVNSSHLKNGHTQSCGCLNVESHIKHNKYDVVHFEYGVGYTSSGQEFYFDLEDYNKIYPYTWYMDKDGYIVSDTYGKHIKMHKLIMNAINSSLDIDHKNERESRHDNRKENLRVCTRSENCMNKTYMSNNTSGCIGVVWVKNIKKWWARITVKGKTIDLGRFENKQDAINARIEGEKKYFGEFAPKREVI